MESDIDATISPDSRACRGAGGVLVRIEQRGQLDEIDVPHDSKPDNAGARHRCSNISPTVRGPRRRRGHQFLRGFQRAGNLEGYG